MNTTTHFIIEVIHQLFKEKMNIDHYCLPSYVRLHPNKTSKRHKNLIRFKKPTSKVFSHPIYDKNRLRNAICQSCLNKRYSMNGQQSLSIRTKFPARCSNKNRKTCATFKTCTSSLSTNKDSSSKGWRCYRLNMIEMCRTRRSNTKD